MYQDSTTISTCPRCVATCNTTDPFPFQKKNTVPSTTGQLVPCPTWAAEHPTGGGTGHASLPARDQRKKNIHVNLLTFHQICASDNRTDTAPLPLQGLHHGSNNSTRWRFAIRG